MPLGTGTILGPNLYQLSLTAAAQLAAVPANPSRLGLTIQNNSAAVVTFTFGTATTPVSQATGIQIPANANFTLPGPGIGGFQGNIGAQVNFISSSAGPNNCTVLEYF